MMLAGFTQKEFGSLFNSLLHLRAHLCPALFLHKGRKKTGLECPMPFALAICPPNVYQRPGFLGSSEVRRGREVIHGLFLLPMWTTIYLFIFALFNLYRFYFN